MAFAATTACCKPSPLLAPRASSLRAQALLCRPSSAAATPRGLRAAAPSSAFAVAPRRRAASTGIVCGKVTKGSVPPNFTLKDQDGKTVSLSKYKGKPVVLYFYPADETPGCTKQIIRRREKTFSAFGSFGARSPQLASPLPSKRHGSTAIQATLSSPNRNPQQDHLTIPSQEGIESTAPKRQQPTQEPGTEEEMTNITNDGGRTCELPTWALIGGITAGVALALALSVDAGPAMALGPEGPLVEEFWDNMRRYGLYALTVSTGFAWALVQPIVELLRNPITAVLIIFVIAGGGVLVSQVINAMAGNSDFIYMYEQ